MKKNHIIILVLWSVSACIMFAPFGVISQFLKARDRGIINIEKSPYKKLCYECNRPATKKVNYQLSTRYFCSSCRAPKKLPWNPFNYIWPPESGGNHWVALLLALIIYLPNYYQVFFYFTSNYKKYKASLSGSIWAIIGTVIFWIMLFNLYRFRLFEWIENLF